MNNERKLSHGLLLICLAYCGCTPLKEVNQFATTCQQSLTKANHTGYGYYEYCYDSCYMYNHSGKFLADFDCDCNYAHTQDTLISKEYGALCNYFAALANLSGNVSKIDFMPVAGAISKGVYGTITITAQESRAVNTIATLATDLLTKRYKSKKIKEVIVKYNDTLKIAFELLKLHLDNLKSKIQVMGTELKLRSDILTARAQTEAERFAIIYTYKQRSRELVKVIPGFDRRYQALDKMQKGHMYLYMKIDDLRSEGVKNSVLDLARDINYLSNKN